VTRQASRRRWAGVLCLGAAILLTVWGHYFLPRDWHPLVQVGFWLGCFAITSLAILIALVDLVAVGKETRAERRALLEKTLGEVEAETRRHEAGH
jgi:hypothetical protein